MKSLGPNYRSPNNRAYEIKPWCKKVRGGIDEVQDLAGDVHRVNWSDAHSVRDGRL